LALVLPAAGVYGLLAYSVTRRLPELGLRKALGAPDRRGLGQVLGESAPLTASGVVLGLAGAAAAGQLPPGLLYGGEARDPLAFRAPALIVAHGALLASALPAPPAGPLAPRLA